MAIKIIKASDDEFLNLTCPFCKVELTEVKCKPIVMNHRKSGNLIADFWESPNDNGVAFFCSKCNSLLGITNRPN